MSAPPAVAPCRFASAARAVLPLALACLLAAAAHAQQPSPPLPPADPAIVARETKLAHELRCLVCQNQSIAESNADLAVDLRRQIRELIVQGKSDGEIRDYMTARYGDFVLYRPPFKPTTVLLWLGPALLFAVGGAIALRVVRRRHAGARGASAALTPEEHARAARLLGEDDGEPAAAGSAPGPASPAAGAGAESGKGARR